MSRYITILILLFIFYSSLVSAAFSPISGAKRLMNIFYQNCNAYKSRPYDFIKDGELKGFRTQYNPKTNGKVSIKINRTDDQLLNYLKCPTQSTNQHLSYLCKNTPSYLWAGKGKVDQNKIDIFHNDSEVEEVANHPGVDCSGFINLSFLLAGLKVDTNIEFLNAPREISAKEFMRPMNCFKNIAIENGKKVHRGDVIAWSKHIVMIDTISNDPFGVNNIYSPEGCDLLKLNPNNAKMVLINSKGSNDPLSVLELEEVKLNSSLYKLIYSSLPQTTGTGPGITRLYLNQMALAYPVEIMEMIQTACLAKFNIHLNSRKWKIVRHVLAEKYYTKKQLEMCSIKKNDQPVFEGNELNCK